MSNITDPSTLPSILSNIQRQITLYGMPLILLFGCGGNLINIGVFLQRTLRFNSCSIYLIASSISHTILLILVMSTNLYSLGNIDPLTYSLAYCKIRPYLISCLFMISRTYIVLACADRYALCSPRAGIRAFSRRQIAFRFIPVVLVIWFILPIHIAIFNTIVANRCIMPGLYNILYAVYAVICAGILPPSLMISFGLLALYNLHLMRQRVAPTTTGAAPRVILKRVDYQIMKMLFVEVTIYCISTLPFPINTFYQAITTDIVKNKDRIAIENFSTFLAGSILQYVNASTALYSNLITSVAFQHETKRFLMYCIRLEWIWKIVSLIRPAPIIEIRATGINANYFVT